MNCPKCGKELERGLISISGTFTSFLIFGFSHQNLWFESKEQKKKSIVTPDDDHIGYRCADCAVTIIDEFDQDFRDLEI